MKKYTYSSLHEAQELIKTLLNREEQGLDVEQEVRKIIKNVKELGDEYLIAQTKLFDCPDLSGAIRVKEQEIQEAATVIAENEYAVIKMAAKNIREFHEAQKENSWFQTKEDGTILGQKVQAVRRAGLYIPGGKGGETPLISSLLMQAIPAKVAGVKEIAIVSPPRKDGSISPHILAAAHLLEIKEVYRVGGPWSIAALAYGTQSIKPVNVITGPGNAYVTMAKKLVQGDVGIDMLAGPSEILIMGDESTNTQYVVADLLSQAEHDTLASAVYITTSEQKADEVLQHIDKAVNSLPRAEIAKKSLQDFGAIIVVPNLQIAVEIVNAIAPEHLEIMTKSPWDLVGKIENAGAMFLGSWSAESIGDYFAGPNHVLPTQGSAKYSSALTVQTFCKKISIISASAEFAKSNAAAIASLARFEGLEAHARSAEERLKNQ